MAHLSVQEREDISILLNAGHSQKVIAQQIGRSESTIPREVRRNLDANGRYRCLFAQRKAIDRRSGVERPKKLDQPKMLAAVNEKLLQNWSPQQISGWLKIGRRNKKISHQTIYNHLWRLPKNSEFRRAMRRKGRRNRKAKPGFILRAIKNRTSIHSRPAIIDARSRIGDWELDLMTCGATSGYLITAVERKSRFTLIRKVASKRASKVIEGILAMFKKFDRGVLKSFTFDNGTEFYYHQRLTRELDVRTFFADPYNSGQRGTNENTNGLIRQYFPSTMTYDMISYWDTQRVQRMLNHRPRLCLNFQTPATILGRHPKIAFQL